MADPCCSSLYISVLCFCFGLFVFVLWLVTNSVCVSGLSILVASSVFWTVFIYFIYFVYWWKNVYLYSCHHDVSNWIQPCLLEIRKRSMGCYFCLDNLGVSMMFVFLIVFSFEKDSFHYEICLGSSEVIISHFYAFQELELWFQTVFVILTARFYYLRIFCFCLLIHP